MSSDDGRIAYLAGEDNGSLPAFERAILDDLRSVLAAPAIWEQPPSTLEDSIVAAIRHEARARARINRRTHHLQRRPTGAHPALGLAGVAAAALVAIVIAVGLPGGRPRVQRFAMIVSGTTLALGAHGHATLTKTSSGWRIQLTATGLPHVAAGRYYEAWLQNTAGTLVPVGTFNDAKAVTLWAGVPATQFPTLIVTVQRATSGPRSSTVRVLIGTVRR